MRFSEIAAREDLWGITSRTLEAGWSEQFRRPIRVSSEPFPGAIAWLTQSLMSAVYRPNLTQAVRETIRDSFRYTPSRRRALPQWLLGTTLAARPVLTRTSRIAFWSDAVPGSENLLVLPGNLRVRTLDFGTESTRSFVKVGFSRVPQLRELNLRRRNPDGPFPTLVAAAHDGRWIEERLIRGFTLPRRPPWCSRRTLERHAFKRLDEWLDARSVEVTASDHTSAIMETLAKSSSRLYELFGTWPTLGRVMSIATKLADCGREPLLLSTSHGDFQAGNVLVEWTTESTYIIDWEATAVRHRYFDALTYHLESHTRPLALRARLRSYLRGEMGYMEGLPFSAAPEKSVAFVRVHLLEEIETVLSAALSGPYGAIPPAAERTLVGLLAAATTVV